MAAGTKNDSVMCFVPNCPFEAEGLLTPNAYRTIPMCRKHAVDWQESTLRATRLEFCLALGGPDEAERLLRWWSKTEAQGLKGDELMVALAKVRTQERQERQAVRGRLGG